MAGSRNAVLSGFGARIRALRTARGWSQEKLAEESGLHRNYIGSTERGDRNVAVVNLVRIAQALGVDPGELVSGLAADVAKEDK